MKIWDKYYNQEPMKYYQPLDYKKQSAIDMINNKDSRYIAEQKFDGEWARMIKEDGRIVIQSRNISKVTGEYGDKTALVPHIVKEFENYPDGTVILGELCFLDETKTARDVGSILRCKPEKAISRQTETPLFFKAFDCLACGGEDYANEKYERRFAILFDIMNEYGVFYTSMTNFVLTDFEDFLQDILTRGGEGIVIHNKDYVYAPGSRPAWTTLKVKRITTELQLPINAFINPKQYYEGTDPDNWDFWYGVYQDTGEVVRINHVPGNIDMEPTIKWEPVTKPFFYGWKNGVIVDNNGVDVRVTSGMTDELRKWLSTPDAEKLLAQGKLYATVSAMEVTPDGSLRHPRLIGVEIKE